MAEKIKKLYGPAFLANAIADIYNQGSALLYTVIRKIHLFNKTGGTVTFRLYIGATGGAVAGTELYFDYPITANAEFNVYGALRLNSTDFLTGFANTANAIIITIEGDLNAV